MEFQNKIKELDYIHARLEAERLALEARSKHDRQLELEVSKIKGQQVQQELRRLDKWKVEMQARHQQIQTEAQSINSNNVLLRREQLHQAKLNFLEELSRRDPQWQTKMQAVRERELKRIEINKIELERQVQNKTQKMKEDIAAQEHILQMRRKIEENETHLKQIELEKEARAKTNAITQQVTQKIITQVGSARLREEQIQLANVTALNDQFQNGAQIQIKYPPINQENKSIEANQVKKNQEQARYTSPKREQVLSDDSKEEDDYQALIQKRHSQILSPQPAQTEIEQPIKHTIRDHGVPVIPANKAVNQLHKLDDADSPSEASFKEAESQQYYDEEHDESQHVVEQESVNRDPTIRIPASRRIDETIQDMPDLQKTMFAGVLLDYITLNITEQNLKQPQYLFEKECVTKEDRELKFKVIGLYNYHQDKLVQIKSDGSFDLSLVCDLLLDLLRYNKNDILKPASVINDYRQQVERNLNYEIGDLCNRIESSYIKEIIKGLLKVVVLANKFQFIKNISLVSKNLAGSLCLSRIPEIANILAQIIDQMVNCGSNIQILGATARSRSSDKSKKSSRLNTVKLADLDRVKYAEQLSTLIHSKASDNPYDDIESLTQYMGSLDAIKHLNKQDLNISVGMAAVVLLLVLKTRTEQNISQDSLLDCEESGDIGHFTGLITNKVPKEIFDIIVKHYAKMVADKHLKQQDAEMLLLDALINFKCSQQEKVSIQQFIIGMLSSQLRMLKAQSKVGGSVSINSYSMQFNNSQYQANIQPMGTRSKLKSSTKTRSANKDSDLDDELGYKLSNAQQAAEFDEPEIRDDDLF